jgi:hypothetical protein
MFLWDNDFQSIFWVAVIPGTLAIALLYFGLDEPKTPITNKRTNPLTRENLKNSVALTGGSLDWAASLPSPVLVKPFWYYAHSRWRFHCSPFRW